MSDPRQEARRFAELGAKLADAVAQDAAAMRTGADLPDPAGLEALAAAYRQAYEALTRDPGRLAALPRAARDALEAEARRLEAALAEHARAYAAFRELSEGLAQSLAAEIARQRRAGAGYGEDGAGRASPAAAAPIALDRSA